MSVTEEMKHELSDERLREILAATEGATPGPWKAGIQEHPWALPARELMGQQFPAATGTHKERWINTTWDHPQANAPVPVVGGSIGVGVDAPVYMVHIEESDARHIANCDPQTITALVTEVLAAREADAWQPIETAPKDGTSVLGAHNAAVFSVWWDEAAGGWVDGSTDLYEDYISYAVTYWRPLPTPPALKETTNAA